MAAGLTSFVAGKLNKRHILQTDDDDDDDGQQMFFSCIQSVGHHFSFTAQEAHAQGNSRLFMGGYEAVSQVAELTGGHKR